MPLDAAEYLAGLGFLAATWGAVGAAAALVVRRRLPGMRGAPRLLAFGLLLTVGIIAAHLLPGMFGLLSRESALVTAVLILAGAWRLPEAAEPLPERAGRTPPPSDGLSWLIAAAGVLVVAAGSLAAARTGIAEASTDIDTLTFHLPNIARWMQSGSFWQVDNFTPLLANGNYPQSGDVIQLAVMQPFQSDAFARLVNLPFALLAALAVYAIAVEAGAARATGVLLGAAFAALPAFVFATGEGAKTDPVMLATFGAGLLFLLRHFRTDARSDLLLAGLGLGLAFGTKWYGVSSVPALLAVWAGVWIWARRPLGALLRNLGLIVAVVIPAGGFWFLRNLVETENPVFPTKVALGGTTLFDAPRDFIRECGGYTLLGYIDSPGIWRDFILPDFRDNYGLPGLLLAAGFVLAVLLAIRGHRSGRLPARSRVAPPLLALAAAVLALVYTATPYSAFGLENEPELVGANTRWLLPALLATAGLAAWAVGRLGALRLAAELLLLVAVVEGSRRGFAEPLSRVVAAGGALIASGLVVMGVQRLAERRGVESLHALAALGAIVAVVAAGAGYPRQRAFHEGRYAEGDPVIAWFFQHPGQREVGLAGVWTTAGLSPVLPAFGPRLENPVSFVGRYVRGQLREFERRESFLMAVRRGGYDVLVVGKGGYGECKVPGREGEERTWARQAGFERLAESDRLVLFRVRPG